MFKIRAHVKCMNAPTKLMRLGNTLTASAQDDAVAAAVRMNGHRNVEKQRVRTDACGLYVHATYVVFQQ